MNLHEYQAKELLKSYGLPVQEGIIAKNGDEAAAAFDKMAGNAGAVVVKAQVHAGGRGKAGGVKIAKTREEAKQILKLLIHAHFLVIYHVVQRFLVGDKAHLSRYRFWRQHRLIHQIYEPLMD